MCLQGFVIDADGEIAVFNHLDCEKMVRDKVVQLEERLTHIDERRALRYTAARRRIGRGSYRIKKESTNLDHSLRQLDIGFSIQTKSLSRN